MRDEALLGPPRVRRRLTELGGVGLNFDPTDVIHPSSLWHVEDLAQLLPREEPGDPAPEGSWDIARRLMWGYEFADPSIVRAFYDTEVPLLGRNMLLKLTAFGVLHRFAGVRVGEVYDEMRQPAGRDVRVWGWNYSTLQGHVEMGRMSWEVWKWLDTGDVEFHVHAVSRPAPIANPFVWLGFRLLRGHERRVFLQSTLRRMRAFTELGLARPGDPGSLRLASRRLTARRARSSDAVHNRLARDLGGNRAER